VFSAAPGALAPLRHLAAGGRPTARLLGGYPARSPGSWAHAAAAWGGGACEGPPAGGYATRGAGPREVVAEVVVGDGHALALRRLEAESGWDARGGGGGAREAVADALAPRLASLLRSPSFDPGRAGSVADEMMRASEGAVLPRNRLPLGWHTSPREAPGRGGYRAGDGGAPACPGGGGGVAVAPWDRVWAGAGHREVPVGASGAMACAL